MEQDTTTTPSSQNKPQSEPDISWLHKTTMISYYKCTFN